MENGALQKIPLMSVIHEEWECFELRLWLNKMAKCSKWGRTKGRLSAGNFCFLFYLHSHLISVKLQPHSNMMNKLIYGAYCLESTLICGVTKFLAKSDLFVFPATIPTIDLLWEVLIFFRPFFPWGLSFGGKVNRKCEKEAENYTLKWSKGAVRQPVRAIEWPSGSLYCNIYNKIIPHI